MAGRPKGSPKTGGRQKGTPNKRTLEIYEGFEFDEEHPTPKAFLLNRMWDEGVTIATRIDCAKAAAPYCHARLQSTEVSGRDGGPIETTGGDTRDLARAILAVLRESQVEGVSP